MQPLTKTLVRLSSFKSTQLSTTLFNKASILIFIMWDKLVGNLNFISKYTHRNELIWSDGFLLDFLQKKSIDLWTRKFLIYTGFLFSERLVFEYVVRLYTDYLILPTTKYFHLELPNVSSVLSVTLLIYIFFFTLSFLLLFILLI